MQYFYLRERTENYLNTVKEFSVETLKKADKLGKKISVAKETAELTSPQKVIEKICARIETHGAFLRENRANIEDEIRRTDRRIQKIMEELKKPLSREDERILRNQMNHLFRMRSRLSDLQRTNDSAIFNLNHTQEELGKLTSDIQKKTKEFSMNPMQRVRKGHLRQLVGKPLKSGYRLIKSANGKYNPIEKKISKADISDHGIESVRLVNQGIKQSKSAVQTTARAAKTAVSAPKKAFQLTRAVINITAAVISHTVAVLFNPVFLIAAVIFIVIFLCSTVIILAAGSESSNQQMTAIGGAYMTMIGIDDISKRYPDAVGYYTIACDNSRNAFSAKIDALYYQDDDLPHSDLMYMKKDDCGMQTEYLKGFASDTYKSMLKNAWSIAIPEREAVAIAYVYLEKQANDAKGTEMGIYDVAFTQEVFSKIVDTAVKVSESSFSGQQCAPPSCTKKTQKVQNPAYAEAYDAFEQCCILWNTWGDFVREPCNAYSDKLYEYEHTIFYVDAQQEAMEKALQKCMDDLETSVNSWYTLYGSRSWDIDENILDYGYSVLGAEYDEAEETLNDTPKTIEETHLTCDGHHTYHSFGFYSYPSNSVMDALGFTDEYKQWMSMCQNGIPKQEGVS